MTSSKPSSSPSKAARPAKLVGTAVGSLIIGAALVASWLGNSSAGFVIGPGQGLVLGSLIVLAAQIRPELTARLVLVLAGLCAGLVLAELGLAFAWRHALTPQLRMHPKYLFELTPDHRDRYVRLEINGGQTIERRVNRSGYRGEELDEPKRDLRVVVYGDSFIEARFSSLENTFAERLEAELRSALGRSVEAVNAGVRAYGPDQIAVRMDSEIPALDPDLVVVTIFAGNDLGELVRNKLFLLSEDGSVVRNQVELSPWMRKQFEQSERGFMIGRLLRKTLIRRQVQASEAQPTLRPDLSSAERIEIWLAKGAREYASLASGQVGEARNLFMDHYDADVSLQPEAESARYKIRVMEGVMAEMKRTARRFDVPLLVMIVPSPIDVCNDYDSAQIDTKRYPDYRPATLTDAFRQLAASHSIPHVDLFDPFSKRDANELYFRGGNNHWNDEGQRVAAEIVGAYVTSARLLEG